ncbi:Rap family tetratricopeptide repeat protein [Cytobacillus purgationiresistens]|uniref:Response regulator aspartate phosphatase I n=1 Tax=Cytobacillus purgationiresistens TaxID=863449 RepID=A0ABU0AES0_9BACI|nr:Rap family tetratricopeptide repeat protein [Cytobacillus purgationiresistens]MDQ0269759.1 response regulator aspartate phosphatase I [Cytobacillus purgationiresistens]
MAVKMAKIDYEHVVNRLNAWYISIKKRNIEEAITLRKEIKNSFDDMEENQDVLLYFSLVDSRYSMMLEEYKKTGEILNAIERTDIEKKTDDMIQYYFYFFSGVYAFYEKKYVKAINFYKIAENKLHKIPDKIEIAEFHYQLAIAFYRIDQHLLSLNHAVKANELFKDDTAYIERTITSKMVIAAIKLDLFQYEESERHYKEALTMAKENNKPFTTGLVYRNLGLNYARRNLLSKAQETLEQALLIQEHHDSVIGIKTMFDLSYVLYKKGLKEEGRQLYEIGNLKAINHNEIEHIAKFNLIHAMYEEYNLKKITESLEDLKKQGLWSEVAELTLDLAIFFKKRNDFQNEALFFEKAHEARDNIIKIMEEIK